MEPADEPQNWRSWPELTERGGYEVRDLDPSLDLGLTSWRPHGLRDARLLGKGVCAERGLSLQEGWFDDPQGAAYMRNERELTLRQDPKSSLLVVAGEKDRGSSSPGPLTFIAAFRVERDGPLRFFLRAIAPPLVAAALVARVLRRRRRASTS